MIKPVFNVLREVGDDVDVHLRTPADGLVHRVHVDYANLTACDMPLSVSGTPLHEVKRRWAQFLTQDMVTCLECLCELDKASAAII